MFYGILSVRDIADILFGKENDKGFLSIIDANSKSLYAETARRLIPCCLLYTSTYRKVHYTQNAKTEGIELSAFVRNPQKFSDMDMTGVNIIQGDALNEEDVLRAMEGQDILFCSLEGDVLTMAKNISCIG